MAKYQLLLPKMGESVAEATIIKWLKKPGDYVEADEAVMEIATDKVDSEVPSPVSGKLTEQLCNENDVVQVGAVIAVIETAVAEAEEPSPAAQPVAEQPVSEPISETKSEEPSPEYKEPETSFDLPPLVPEPVQNIAEGSNALISNGIRFYSPLVRSIATQEGIGSAELDRIPGTGAEGRLTKDDLLGYLQANGKGSAGTNTAAAEPVKQAPPAPAPQGAPVPQPAASNGQQYKQAPAPQPIAPIREAPKPMPQPQPEAKAAPAAPKPAPVEAGKPSAPAVSASGEDEIIEMDRMRRLIADHMVMSKQTSPHVTSFVEADVTNLVHWREKVKNSFEKRENEKITFTPLFIEAVVKAIRDMPMINVSVNGTQIIKKKDINISMATALPSGNLIVPVIKKADELNLVGLTKAVNDLANRARNGKLLPDDVQGGTFTITNVGSFGNVMGTPIINQPQVAILAVGAIKKKPAVVETKQGDMIAIRHMMFLSLSYDHRVVDGALGGSFVRRVADYLEKWDVDREI
jgi:2-oxoglutarate dehydrogenase E2 component (dihydrolipoamide succinyltransferase)